MKKLVLIRHGQSQWNLENRFTGWTDVELSDKGREEAKAAGKALKAAGIDFDLAFTSVLKRAIHTLHFVLDELDQIWLPTTKAWELNERHYGDLQGLNKADTAEKFGDEQVHIWRRSFDISPPAIAEDDPRHPKHDKRYADLSSELLPATESLKITLDRVLPYWSSAIVPALEKHDSIIIAAHGNSLRALIKHLKGIDDDGIIGVEVPTGKPYVFELNDALEVQKDYYLD